MSEWSERNELVDFDATVEQITDKAILCDIDGMSVWIPKSQLESGSELDEDSEIGDEGNITIKRWLAEEKGLY